MTWGGKLISLFPAIYIFCLVAGICVAVCTQIWWMILVILAELYLLPLVCFRIHHVFFPLREGASDLSRREYSPWWASYMFQYPFIAWPCLESALHFFPGLFSLWLRAWGSRVGKQILWTPRVDILDRSLLEVGDRAIIGHMTAMSCHMVAQIDGKPMLVIKKIKIGERSLLSVDTQLGPGAIIEPGEKLPPKTRRYWRGIWP